MRTWEREPPKPQPPQASSPPSSSSVQAKFSVSSMVVKPSDSIAGGSDFESVEDHAAGSRIRDEFPSSPLRPRSQRFQQESGNRIRADSVSPIHQQGPDLRYDRDGDHSKAKQNGREIWGGMGNGKFRDHSPSYGHERGGERYRDLSPNYGRGRNGVNLRDVSPLHGHGKGIERFQDFSPAYGRGRGRGRGRGSFHDISPPFGREREVRFRDYSPPFGHARGRGRFQDLSPPHGRGRGRGRFHDFSPTYGRGRYRDFSPSDPRGGGPGRGFREPSPPYGPSKGGGRFRDLSPPFYHERDGRSLERDYAEPEPGPLPVRGESVNRNDPNLAPRVGDWICRDPLCGNLNFARRDYCNNCNKFRYEPGDVMPARSPRRSYSSPPPQSPPPRRAGPPVRHGMRRDVRGYRSLQHGWAREVPLDPPPPKHGERFLGHQIPRRRPDYDEEADYRERSKFEKPVPYELDYRDHPRDEFVSVRRGRLPSSPDQWMPRERSRSPVRDRSMSLRQGSFMGRGRGGRGRIDGY